MSRHCRSSFLLFHTLFLAGCGVAVSRIGEPWDKDYPGGFNAKHEPTVPITASGQIEFEVKKNIYCMLRTAVKQTDAYHYKTHFGNKKTNKKFLPDEWGAQIALSFQVDENVALNPGVTLNTPLQTAISSFAGATPVMTPQSSSVGLGGTLSSTASRTDKFNSYFNIGYLRSANAVRSICENEKEDPFVKVLKIQPAKSSFLADELGINRWLFDAIFVTEAIPSYGAPSDSPASGRKSDGKIENNQDTISIEIKFVIVTSGNVTPTWKLVRISANTGTTPFFGAGRTRTHDLIITIGPKGTQSDYANLALQIGQAVSGGNRSSALTP